MNKIDTLKQQKPSWFWLAWCVVLILLLGAVWQYRTWQQQQSLATANQQLFQLKHDSQSKNWPQAIINGEQLMNHHQRDLFGELAGLLVSQSYMQLQQLPKAIVTLQWVIDYAPDETIRELAKLQKAMLQSTTHPADSMALVKTLTNPSSWQHITPVIVASSELSEQHWAAARASLSSADPGWRQWILPAANPTVWPELMNPPAKLKTATSPLISTTRT